MPDTKKPQDHAGSQSDDGSSEIDFAWCIFIGMQIGYTERQIARMYYGKWVDMYQEFKKYHNMKINRIVFDSDEVVSIMDL